MTKLFSLPTLYKISSGGKLSEWKIWGEYDEGPHSQEFNVGKYSFVVEHGYIDGKKQLKKTVISEGKNIGKANETSVEEQVKLEAESKWRKQLDKGYSENREVETRVIRPMLAHKFSEHGHKILYPCYIQPKMDGLCCLGIKKDGKVGLFSRLGKQFTAVTHIEETLADLPENIIVHGELYNHDIDFQKIISAIKRDDPNENTNLIEFHLYDCILLDNLEATYSERYHVLQYFHDLPSIKIVHTPEIQSEAQIQYFHDYFVSQGFEGAMLRNKHGIYKIDGRSHDLLKVKSFQDVEYKIVGAEKDKNDHCVFSCENEKGIPFSVKMKGTDEFRKNLWFNREKYVGKMLTVKFFELTNDGIPRFPVGISIRDYEN